MKYRSLHKWKYELLAAMECKVDIQEHRGNDYIFLMADILLVRARYAWDGASFIARDTPTNMRASLFHDALTQLINEGLLDKKYRKYADELLRTHMLEDQEKYADGLLWTFILEDGVVEIKHPVMPKKMTGLKRSLYLRWGRFRANGYYIVVRAYSKMKGM